MGKQITEETVAKAVDKATSTAVKTSTRNATDAVKAEAERIKASDLGRAEKKAALEALANVKSKLKS